MNLSAGIVGLPNVGKSSLFNAITNSQVEVANYAFATIEPNVGIVNLKDPRLENLANLINPEKITYATFKFVDIAGLVKGASKGQGLGNKFLQNIKEVNAICHVVRCFNDPGITHHTQNFNSVTDAETINLELILSDLEIVTSKIERLKGRATSGDTNIKKEYDFFLKLKDILESEKMLNSISFTDDELDLMKPFSFLSLKPMIYIANLNDEDTKEPMENLHYKNLVNFAGQENVVPISIKIELEISLLDENDQLVFKNDLGIQESGLNKIVSKSYEILNLETYFTFGKKEVRAWSYKKGMTAQECAGIIHSDFARGFIKAEVMDYKDLIEIKDEFKLKELGKSKLVGRDYIVNDGEIYHFKFNV